MLKFNLMVVLNLMLLLSLVLVLVLLLLILVLGLVLMLAGRVLHGVPRDAGPADGHGGYVAERYIGGVDADLGVDKLVLRVGWSCS